MIPGFPVYPQISLVKNPVIWLKTAKTETIACACMRNWSSEMKYADFELLYLHLQISMMGFALAAVRDQYCNSYKFH